MDNEAILATIDAQIAKLQQARALLTDTAAPTPRKSPGRPKKLVSNAATGPAPNATPKAKTRVMSDEARARIAAAQRKRWATAKRASK